MLLRTMKIEDLIPYENNPRINAGAVNEVKESIKQVGYITPIIIDINNEILAGHTRYQALKELGFEEVECIIMEDITPEQRKKFRLLDNKIGEIADWDLDKLKIELGGVDFENYQGFAYLQQEDKAGLDDIIVEFEEKEIKCPKCGAVVEADED